MQRLPTATGVFGRIECCLRACAVRVVRGRPPGVNLQTKLAPRHFPLKPPRLLQLSDEEIAGGINAPSPTQPTQPVLAGMSPCRLRANATG